jgi:hypothetical protein
MFDKNKFEVVEGWETVFVQDTIRSWERELKVDEAKENYEAFVLTIQKVFENEFSVSIEVALSDGVGDLLSGEYTETCNSETEAIEAGKGLIRTVEEKYNL